MGAGKPVKVESVELVEQSPDRPQVWSGRARDFALPDQSVDFVTYWRVLRKRVASIFAITFVLFVVVLIGTLRQTPLYEATVLLEIRNEDSNAITLQQLFELDSVSDTYLETQYEILRSTSLAQRVIDDLRLDTLDEFNPPPMFAWSREKERVPNQEEEFLSGVMESSDYNSRSYQNALATFSDRLSIRPVKRSRLVKVGLESADPELAARIVNSLASNYISLSLEARWNATQKATEWLTGELKELKINLERSEEGLHRHARARGLLFLETEVGDGENIVNERLRALQDELIQAEADFYQKEALYRVVETGRSDALPSVIDNALIKDLTVTLANLKRERAQLLATFHPEYPKVREIQGQIGEIERILNEERDRELQRIEYEYRAAVGRHEALLRAFMRQRELASDMVEKSVQYNILKREVETNRELYEGLLQRVKEAGVSAGVTASNIRIVDPAMPPKKPSSPKVLLNLALSLVLGAAIGVGLAFLQEYIDNTLKNPEDVNRYLQLPALASIPSIQSLNGHAAESGLAKRFQSMIPAGAPAEDWHARSWFRIDQLQKPYSSLVEAFSGLRTSVLLSSPDHPPRTILLTSAQPGEGKTSVSCNLGLSLAQMGRKVLLVDFDMRRPSIQKVFGIEDTEGAVHYMIGEKSWKSLVQTNVGVEGLHVLPCGPIPPNPAELIASDRVRVFLKEASLEYDFVLLDSPPLGNVADARMLAALVDGTVLVIRGGSTPREAVLQVQSYLADAGAHVLGVVLNKLDFSSSDYYYSRDYGYYYTEYGAHEEEGDVGAGQV